jgi:hypothetical protein
MPPRINFLSNLPDKQMQRCISANAGEARQALELERTDDTTGIDDPRHFAFIAA